MTDAGRRVGLIGVGNMGGRIGRRLNESGVDIVGYHRDAAKVERWGLTPAVSVRELVGNVDVVALCLPDSPVAESVMLGDGGVLEALRAGQLVVDFTSALPGSTIRLAALAADKGAGYVDAPVSGGARSVAGGKLTIMAGGDEKTVAALGWLFAPIAAAVHYMGGPGAGHTTKILNNFLSAISLAATSEAMIGAKLAGLDPAKFLEVVSTSSGRNYATETRFPALVKGDYLESAGGITVDLMVKDVASFLSVAAELDIPSYTGPGALAAFKTAVALGYGARINNRVVDALGDVAGGIRLAEPAPGATEA
jgi:3-hydroxyisobutyrate dehydrogenase-like beta-hydroxyacid dehydrogenase